MLNLNKQRKRNLTLGLIFLIIIFLFVIFVFASTQLFYDDFNDGNVAGWTSSGGGSWSASNVQTYDTYSARYYCYTCSPANFTPTNPISTVGYESITFSYQRRTSFLGGGDSLIIYWTDGTNYYQLWGGTTATEWQAGSHDLPSGASENPNFNILFNCHHDGGYWDVCNIDNIKIEGTWNYPLIDYAAQTPNNGAFRDANSLYINWTFVENNVSTIKVFLYNTSSLVNTSIFTSATNAINFTGLSDETYIYYIWINDTYNNINQTGNRTITLDSIYPLVDYTIGTPNEGITTKSTSLFVNVTVTESNEANITFLLYDETSEVNKTTFTDSIRTINFTGLTDGTYSYNVTVTDEINKKNTTITRIITLDNSASPIDYASETKANNTFINSDTIYINWTFLESSLSAIQVFLYDSTSLVNNTLFSTATSAINISSLPNNQYIYYVFINDSVNNYNKTINRTITLDSINPLIDYDSETPSNGLNTSKNSIYVEVLVTETNEQNITFLLYNSTSEVNSTTFTDATRNINFTNLPDENYYYNVTITDKVNQINYTETRHLTIDSTNPLISYDSETQLNNSYIDSETIYINWSYIDTNLNTIQIFLYNTTSLVNNSLYTNPINGINITVNNKDEIYTYYIFINDSANNQNKTINRTITLDNTYPLIDYSEDSPANGLNTTTASIFINVSVTETNEQNITFLLYNSSAQANISIFNDSTRTINFTNLPDDTYYYNITLIDKTNKLNTTITRHLTVDTTGPLIANVTIDPDNLDDIDPSTFINITANIDDDRLVSSVIMQYKRTGAYINKTMSNPSGNLYVSNFTTDIIEGIYYYRFVMNDSLGNTVVTEEYNLSSTYDFTWSVTPTTMTEVSGSLEEEKSVGVITINNTGDGTLLFTLSNNWVNLVEYNVSNPFYLAAKAKESINLTTTLANTDSRLDMAVTITASHTTETPSPLVRTSNVTIISSAGGPVMSLELVTTPSTSVEQGQTINGKAKLRNIGNETSPNTTLIWGFENSFWQNISGNKTERFTNFSAGAIEYSNITLNVTYNVTAGVYVIPINVSCFKSNGSRCSSNAETSLTFAVAVTCSNIDSVCGAGCNYLTDSDCPEPENTTLEVTNTVSTGGSSGGSSSAGGAKKVEKDNIVSGEVIEVIRGKDTSFNLSLKNNYKGVMKDITIEVSGFLSQYIELEEIPKSLKPGKTYDIKVNIIAPEYLSRQDFELSFLIKAIIEETKEGDVISRLNFQEIRNVILAVHELGKEDAIELLNLSEIEINKIKALNLSATKLEKILELAFKNLDKREYELIKETYDLIQSTVETALDIHTRIDDLRLNIENARNKGLETPNTERLMNLAFFALSREDYVTALERIKEAEFTFNIETKGEFSIMYYVKNNPLQSSLLVILGLFLTSGSIFSIRYSRIKIELNKLGKEKVILTNLIKTAQKECFEENMVSVEEYQTSLKQYENRLSAIAQREIELITLKSALLNPALKKNEFERKRILDLIKQTQDEYIIQGKQETRSYRDKIKNYFSRLSEIENKLALKESKKAIKKEKRKLFYEKFKFKHNKKRFHKPKKIR